ncbi:MAG: response regulator [Gammaproteobacteria bacterium]|nr:response regulator [Gammaproteobacteria bacterium]MDH5653882.1 response regulator [Gammaproteobacteria bacterium]
MSGAKVSALSNKNVLMVEDNIVNQKVTAAMLRHFGIIADVAENGQIAMAMLQEKKYDIILMDCQMPVLNGFDATRAIRKLENAGTNKDVPVLAMTANASPDAMSMCFDSGMNDIIAKPVELDVLSEKLHKWLCVENDHTVTLTAVPPGSINMDSLKQILDPAAIDELHEIMEEGLFDVLQAFNASMQEHIPALQDAVENGDEEAVARITHTMKGSSANIGALSLSETCRVLMENARNNDLTGADELTETIAREFSNIHAVLTSL